MTNLDRGDSMAVVVKDHQELATKAITEHQLCKKAAESALAHAVLAGEALLAAKAMIPKGEWEDWLDANCAEIPRSTVGIYMRLAYYQDRLDGIQGVAVALRLLRGLPATDGSKRIPREDRDALRTAVKQLRFEGKSYREIGRQLGVNRDTVQRWCLDKPVYENLRQKKRSREKAARAALRRQENEKLVKSVGGKTDEAYALVRRAAQIVDSLAATAATPAARVELGKALGALYRAEDHIIAALKERA